MDKFFDKAVENFVISIGGSFGKCKNLHKDGFISKIEIKGDINKSVHLFIPKETLDTVSMLLFGEKDYNLPDLTNEIANLIVGNAKVIASNENVNFNISTPKFLDIKDIKYENRKDYSIDGECFSILY